MAPAHPPIWMSWVSQVNRGGGARFDMKHWQKVSQGGFVLMKKKSRRKQREAT
jgi:hypothetical protein